MARLSRVATQEHNRAKVLAAARAAFTEYGFRDTKIDQIAVRAELTRGAVYSNFPSKRALYFAVLAKEAARVLDPEYPPTATRAGAASATPATRTPAATTPATATGTTPVGPTPAGPTGSTPAGSTPTRTTPTGTTPAEYAPTPAAAMADFARAWLARLPLASDDEHSPTRLGRDLLPEIMADVRVSQPFAQLTSLSAIVLGQCLENLGLASLRPRQRSRAEVRMVGVAELALTTLHGAGQLTAAAPGFNDPFAVVLACQQLVGLDLSDHWAPTHLPHIAPARPVDQRWAPTAEHDALRDEPVDLDQDGVVAVLGLHRLAAVEEALRAAPPTEPVTAVLVTSDPGELGPLARLVCTELRNCLRAAVPASAWPRLRIVHDETGALASAAGVSAVSDATETAVRVRAGRIVALAEGFGACHAAATV